VAAVESVRGGITPRRHFAGRGGAEFRTQHSEIYEAVAYTLGWVHTNVDTPVNTGVIDIRAHGPCS